jgi:ABC-type phosphate transport system permease subunit
VTTGLGSPILSTPKAEFKTALAPAAIIVLMAITFLCNGVALFLRNRYDKRW